VKGERKKDIRGALVLLLFPLAISLLLNGCGFHLRGPVALPEVMHKTYISGGEGSELYYAVENELENAGARVVDSAASASAVLSLQSQRFDRRVISVDTQGRAAEYELSLQVAFSLRDSAGRHIADNEQVSVIRDFSFNPDSVLAKDHEEAALRSEMMRYAVAQMMRRLQALTRQPAPATAGE
jgi:LPS-assembly lipoprotein